MRVVSLNNIPEGERLTNATLLYKCFKSEPHTTVFGDKVGDKASPYSLYANLSDASRYEISIANWNLTPMEKNAKREESFPKKETVLSVNRRAKDYIDESIVSYASPVSEEGEAALPESEEIEKPLERFEQISIFGDDD